MPLAAMESWVYSSGMWLRKASAWSLGAYNVLTMLANGVLVVNTIRLIRALRERRQAIEARSSSHRGSVYGPASSQVCSWNQCLQGSN